MHIRSGSSYAASQTTFLPPCAAKPWLTFASRKTVRWSSIGIEPILETAANKNKTFFYRTEFVVTLNDQPQGGILTRARSPDTRVGF